MHRAIKALRNDREIVSYNGCVKKDIYFSSPSAAAIFVTGRSSNGYVTWRIDDKISLKKYREHNQ